MWFWTNLGLSALYKKVKLLVDHYPFLFLYPLGNPQTVDRGYLNHADDPDRLQHVAALGNLLVETMTDVIKNLPVNEHLEAVPDHESIAHVLQLLEVPLRVQEGVTVAVDQWGHAHQVLVPKVVDRLEAEVDRDPVLVHDHYLETGINFSIPYYLTHIVI